MPETRGNRVNVVFGMALNDENVIDITSGALQAKLHKERFICPGINRECIEYNGLFLTPKAFYVLADKASLKDWKNAIRINGKKIRRYIESGELDFYNHAELCTGRCKSRGQVKNTIIMENNMASPMASPMVASPMVMGISRISEHTYSSLPDSGQLHKVERVSPTNDSYTESDSEDVKPSIDQLNLMMMLKLRPEKNGDGPSSSSSPSMITVNPPALPAVLYAHGHGEGEEEDEDKMFWRAIVELGLVDEFFREIKSKLDGLKNSMIKNYVPISDAKKASLIVNELGMRSKLDLRLCAHKCEFDRQRDRLDKEMEQLKRKVMEYEMKKDVLKRKSDCFDHLMSKKPKFEDDSGLESSPCVLTLTNGDRILMQSPLDSSLSDSPCPASQDSTLDPSQSSSEGSSGFAEALQDT